MDSQLASPSVRSSAGKHSEPRSTLKIYLILPLLLLGNRMIASDIAVFGEKDFYVVGAGSVPAGPSEPAQSAFFDGFRADIQRHQALEASLELVNPPSWGKTVAAATHGTIQFRPSFPGGFTCHIALENLLPDHDYILTLNGNPAKDGNGLLPSEVPGNPQERYYDFLIIRTDARGHFDAGLGVFLKPGNYDVRCYVKDTGDFKIVLYRDFFKFSVK